MEGLASMIWIIEDWLNTFSGSCYDFMKSCGQGVTRNLEILLKILFFTLSIFSSFKRNMNSFQAGSGIFPDAVIFQILARLPIKSLFRFKSVCKLWCKLPSNKHFIQLYNAVSLRNPVVLIEILEPDDIVPNFICVDRLSSMSEFSLDFLDNRVKIKASSNGFLCCASIPSESIYYVCNPMTREFNLLPRSRARLVSRYNPHDKNNIVGLIVDPSTRKYNVVMAGFFYPSNQSSHGCLVGSIYNSERNSWKRFISSWSDEFWDVNREQVLFASNSLHWMTYTCSHMLVLDLYSVVWKKIPLPGDFVNTLWTSAYLVEMEGSVSVIRIVDDWMSIWVLKDYASEDWTLEDTMSLQCIRTFMTGAVPISLSRDFVFLATETQVLIYSHKDKLWKEMYSKRGSSSNTVWLSAHAFRSTLFSC